jgi:hypothetical protein
MIPPPDMCLAGCEIDNDDDLEKVPVDDIDVATRRIIDNDAITKEVQEKLHAELVKEGKVWRTSKALADKLNVDVVALDDFLQKQPSVCVRPSKDEGVFLYALLKRLEAEESPQRVQPMPVAVEEIMRPLIKDEDKYAIASLHNAYVLLDMTMKKYAMRIYERNSEAFTQLASAKDKLEAGIVLYAKKLKIDLSKLP